MRIAVVCWDLTISGGTQRQALELARYLSTRHEVDVWAYAYDPDRCYPDLSRPLGVKALSRQLPSFGTPRTGIGRVARLARPRVYEFEREIRSLAESLGSYDVLNGHDIWTERVAHVYKERFPRTPAVLMSNDAPIAFVQVRMNARRRAEPAGFLRRAARGLLRPVYERARREEVRYLQAVDRILVLDERNRAIFRDLAGREATVVRSGLDIDGFQPRFEKANAVFTILATGILFPHRRFEDAIRAVALVRDRGVTAELRIVGSPDFAPDYASFLQTEVTRLGLADRVSFLGRVSEADLREEYRAADVFVFPNHEQTWGLAVFEAMASGTPVVVSRTAGASEVLAHTQNALLVDPKEPRQLADALARLVEDRELYGRLQREGRRFVERNISWSRYGAAVERELRAAADASA